MEYASQNRSARGWVFNHGLNSIILKIQKKLFAEKAKSHTKQHKNSNSMKKEDWYFLKSWVEWVLPCHMLEAVLCPCPWVQGGRWQPPTPQPPLTHSQMFCAGMCNISELPREGAFLQWPMKCVSPSSSTLHRLRWALTTGDAANASGLFALRNTCLPERAGGRAKPASLG